ncbi:MAG: hypothetical protein U0527_01315 [Candidatus Eisenbacteria bacterium]
MKEGTLRTAIIAGVLGLALASSTAIAAEPAGLRPLAFLLGEWASPGSGQPGEGTGTAVFRRDLQNQVIVRSSYAEYPATDQKPGTRHDDLMVIYVEGGGEVRADYFDSERHAIHYTVQSPGADQAVFLSDVAEGAPRFRLTYTLDPDGVLEGAFEIAPPGTPDAFKPYLSWQSHKATTTAK